MRVVSYSSCSLPSWHCWAACSMSFGAVIGAIPALSDLIGKFIRDPKAAQEFESQLATLMDASDQRQTALNMQYAKNGGLYMAGYRPFIAWCTGLAWVFAHLAPPVLVIMGDPETARQVGESFADGAVDTMLWAILGMFGIRSVDKKFLNEAR